MYTLIVKARNDVEIMRLSFRGYSDARVTADQLHEGVSENYPYKIQIIDVMDQVIYETRTY